MVLNLNSYKLERIVSSEGEYDYNGDWVAGTDEICDAVCCDGMPNGNSNVITYEDGTVVSYSYILILPVTYPYDFRIGEPVMVTLPNGKRREFSVKSYQPYQLQKKLWV